MTSHSILHVVIKDLRGICHLQGPADGYFHIEVYCDQNHKQKTKTVHGLNPTWNEPFTIQLGKTDSFVAFCAYEELAGKSVLLATATLQFQKITGKPEDHIQIELLNAGRNSGELTVQLYFDK